MAIIDAIDHWAEVSPERTAYLSGDRSLTYAEVARRSDILADYLIRTFSPTAARLPIAIYGHKEPEMLIAFLAAVKSGHPYIPLDIALPQQRIDSIMSASQALTLLTPSEVADRTENAALAAVDRSRCPAGDDPFYIMFTSGSTGAPKGVVISARNLQSFVDWTIEEQKFSEQREIFLDQAPFSFDLSIMDVFPCLVTGNTLFSIASEAVANPAQLYRVLSGSQVTTWVSTPSFAQMCLVEKSFNAAMLPKLTRFLFCGETLAVDLAATLRERFPQAAVWNTYGPTEATVATTSVRIDENVLQTYAPLPVGYPKPGSHVLIMNDVDEVLPEGQHGQIIIAGENVSAGYLGRPDLTGKAFFDLDGERAYRTGDQGYMYNGLLFFEGRRDYQIKLRGHRIEIGDIEANLQSLPHIRDAIVVVKMKNAVPDSLSAFVIYDNRENLPEAECIRLLRAQIGARLPIYMIPRRFYFLTAFPMTANGKADRKKLAESQP